MADKTRLKVNAENAVYEEVDGELIVIDLASGSYFSLSGSGPAIWAMLVESASAAEICATLESRYEVEPDEIEAAVADLLASLGENGLTIPAETDAAAPAPPAGDGSREPFAAPVFERYTDMKDYFLLDPIHEVDPAGWPKPAA